MTRRILISIALVSAFTPFAWSGQKNFVYLHAIVGGDDAVLGFRMKKSGKLSPVPGSPFSDPGNGYVGAWSPTLAFVPGRNLLVSAAYDGISVFRVASNGALAPVTGSPFSTDSDDGYGYQALAVVETSGGVFVYAIGGGVATMHGYRLESNDTLTHLDSTPVSTTVYATAITARGQQLVVSTDSSKCCVFSVSDQGVPTEAAGSPFTVGVIGQTYARFAPSAGQIYVSDNPGNLCGYDVDPSTGAISALFTDPLDTGLAEAAAGVTVGRKVAFAFASLKVTEPDVQAFRRDADGGLTLLGAAQTTGLDGVTSHALDSKGKVLAVADYGNGSASRVRTFRVNKHSGSLALADEETIATPSVVGGLVIVRR